MTERDVFELRFHAAVRGYVGRVSSDLDPVELAHRIAAASRAAAGRGGALGWRGVAIPRLAWILLLLAGCSPRWPGRPSSARGCRTTSPFFEMTWRWFPPGSMS